MTPLVLVAHGSRDPRAAAVTARLATAVRAAAPRLPVHVAFLDHAVPRPEQVLAGLRSAVVVPLLLTSAYHAKTDLPAVLAAVDTPVQLAGVLGPDPLLVAGVARKVAELGRSFDGLVLAAAGSTDSLAVATVQGAATALGRRFGVPCVAAFASAAAPTVPSALGQIRAYGARQVGVGAYFLAPGQLYDRVRAAGVSVSEPLGDAAELVELVLTRYRAAKTTMPGRVARASSRS